MELWGSHKEESENKRKAIIITAIVNVLILLAIYFIVVWRQPIPPIPQFGLELNLGFTEVGSGNNQTRTPPSESQNVAQEIPAPGQVAPTPTEPALPKPQPETQTAKPTPAPATPTYEPQSKAPSPLKATEKTTETSKETPVKQESSVPVTKPAEKDDPKTTEKAEEKPQIDQRAIFGAGGTTGTGQQTSSGSSQGTSNQKGDEGNPQGTVDGRSIMQTGQGNAGDGAGYNLDLAGWDFASKPNIQDNVSTRNGRIIFRITVDDNGKIMQAIPLEYNVSNEVLAYYRTVVNQLTFKRQGGNPSADYSTGKITFIIKVD
ncbi:energy transducer TonB [Pararhodonellum marinum]|uniref:energy transducer TonB n=1 Tax=Pararhodonellum marinum TaxID=2755358 RepID=UPI0018901C7D|nr:energy transducer TonB [Pararhodonellum marinum]